MVENVPSKNIRTDSEPEKGRYHEFQAEVYNGRGGQSWDFKRKKQEKGLASRVIKCGIQAAHYRDELVGRKDNIRKQFKDED